MKFIFEVKRVEVTHDDVEVDADNLDEARVKVEKLAEATAFTLNDARDYSSFTCTYVDNVLHEK